MPDERRLLLRLADLFRQFDPSIVVAHDSERMGIGYVCERAKNIGLTTNFEAMLSRVKSTVKNSGEM